MIKMTVKLILILHYICLINFKSIVSTKINKLKYDDYKDKLLRAYKQKFTIRNMRTKAKLKVVVQK